MLCVLIVEGMSVVVNVVYNNVVSNECDKPTPYLVVKYFGSSWFPEL